MCEKCERKNQTHDIRDVFFIERPKCNSIDRKVRRKPYNARSRKGINNNVVRAVKPRLLIHQKRIVMGIEKNMVIFYSPPKERLFFNASKSYLPRKKPALCG